MAAVPVRLTALAYIAAGKIEHARPGNTGGTGDKYITGAVHPSGANIVCASTMHPKYKDGAQKCAHAHTLTLKIALRLFLVKFNIRRTALIFNV